ncbi:MAG: hypothetical protein QM753_06070 [Thermomicrobiales bacterium]
MFGQGSLELDQAVLPRRILRERPLHQRCPLRIDRDAADDMAINFLGHVAIPKRSASRRPTVHRLMQHLRADVLAALPDLDLVHDVGDGLHGVGHVPLAKVLLCRDQLDIHLGQDALGEGGVGLVAEDTRACIDDDVADLGMLLQVGEQLAEDGALGNGLRGMTRLNEFLDDRHVELCGALPGRLALRGDRGALGVDVARGMHLALGRDPQIEHGSPLSRSSGRARLLRIDETQQVLYLRDRAHTLLSIHSCQTSSVL